MGSFLLILISCLGLNSSLWFVLWQFLYCIVLYTLCIWLSLFLKCASFRQQQSFLNTCVYFELFAFCLNWFMFLFSLLLFFFKHKEDYYRACFADIVFVVIHICRLRSDNCLWWFPCLVFGFSILFLFMNWIDFINYQGNLSSTSLQVERRSRSQARRDGFQKQKWFKYMDHL